MQQVTYLVVKLLKLRHVMAESRLLRSCVLLACLSFNLILVAAHAQLKSGLTLLLHLFNGFIHGVIIAATCLTNHRLLLLLNLQV